MPRSEPPSWRGCKHTICERNQLLRTCTQNKYLKFLTFPLVPVICGLPIDPRQREAFVKPTPRPGPNSINLSRSGRARGRDHGPGQRTRVWLHGATKDVF